MIWGYPYFRKPPYAWKVILFKHCLFLPGGYSWVQTIRRFPVFFLRKVRCRELGKELGRELGKGKGTGKTQQIQSRPRKGIGKTKQLQSCLRKRVGKAQQLQSCLRKGNGRRPELNQQSARKDNISQNRKNKVGTVTLHILCAPAGHRPPYRRWTNYSNPCNPIKPRTPNYNVVFLVWFAPLNGRNKSNPKIRNKDTEP